MRQQEAQPRPPSLVGGLTSWAAMLHVAEDDDDDDEQEEEEEEEE